MPNVSNNQNLKSTVETEKRLALANKYADTFRDFSEGVILAVSLVYSPNNNVNEKSDIDLLIVGDNIKAYVDFLDDYMDISSKLRNRFFDGYSLKFTDKDVPISLHILRKDAFDVVAKSFVANLRMFRKDSKTDSYSLHSFDGGAYNYWIKNVPLSDCKGYRTIVPISFIADDKYYIGIHRDKLLSNPKILYDNQDFVSDRIDNLWHVVAENLIDESRRLLGKIDLNRNNILNALSRKDKMNKDVVESIKEKTEYYVSKLK